MTALTLVSTGTNPDGWRAWWREQARLDGSDWGSLLDRHREVFQHLCESVGVVMLCPTCDRDPCPTPTFCAACRKADAAKRPQDPHTLRDRAAAFTVEALMFELRGGTKVLRESAVKRRLSELSEAQVRGVGARLQRLKPEIAKAWGPDEVVILISTWTGLKNGQR